MAYEYQSVDTSTEEGLQKAERLKRQGWDVYNVGFSTLQFQREKKEKKTRTRKTRDIWRFYVNYGQGWEYEIAEYTLANMRENRKAYRENCHYPLRIVKGREKIES